MTTDDISYQFEDYGEYDAEKKHWKSCSNMMLISEDSLSRTLRAINNSSFAILTAYRSEFSKEQNIERNRKLRAFLNFNRMGVHQIVGHYIEDRDGEKVNVVERSYLVEKPEDMSDKKFASLIIGCLTIDGSTQESALVKFKSKGEKYWFLTPSGNIGFIGTKLTLGKIGEMYSQHVKKMNVPFVFEGEETPGSVLGRAAYKKSGFCWSGHNGFGFENA